nr:hypothetical protein [Tanacetum cinerariifolium]
MEGVTTEVPITTAEEKAQKRLEVKARTTKKTQRNLLKQQYENFTAPSLKMIDQTFDRLQKLVSQLELLEEMLSKEDVNQNLLRSLSPEWNTHVVVWRNKADLDTISMDDLYNNIKVYKLEVKGMSSSSSSTSNMAFVSSLNNNTSNTNGAVNTTQVVNTSHRVSTTSTQVNAAYFTNIDNMKQIHQDDTEEIDLRWQMAMLTIRARSSTSTGNFMPPTTDLSFTGLDEFVNKTVVEICKAKPSEEESKVVRKNHDVLIIEEWVSINEEDDASQLKIEKKTVRHSIVKKYFVKYKQQEKTAK